MHTTAISPMRAYCVYAGTLPPSKKKKNTVKKLADKKGNSSFNQQIKNEFVKRDFK